MCKELWTNPVLGSVTDARVVRLVKGADAQKLGELVVIWRKLARLYAADPTGPWGALLSPVASEALTMANRNGLDVSLILEDGGIA